MKNINEVLLAKQDELRRVEREVEALEIVQGLLQEPGDPPAPPKNRWP